MEKLSTEWTSERLWLRVTIRCLIEDLRLAPDAASLPLEDLDDAVALAFVRQRSQNPIGQETIQGMTHAAEVYSLHAGEWRGGTWHDRANHAVWLVAARFHRSGKPDDAYPYFRDLDRRDRILPTEDDYDLLAADQEPSFAEALIEHAGRLVEKAQQSPGSEVRALLGGTVPVAVCVEREGDLELVSVAVSMRWVEGGLRPPLEWHGPIQAAFFPWAADPTSEIGTTRLFCNRAPETNEYVFSALRGSA